MTTGTCPSISIPLRFGEYVLTFSRSTLQQASLCEVMPPLAVRCSYCLQPKHFPLTTGMQVGALRQNAFTLFHPRRHPGCGRRNRCSPRQQADELSSERFPFCSAGRALQQDAFSISVPDALQAAQGAVAAANAGKCRQATTALNLAMSSPAAVSSANHTRSCLQ